MTQPGSFQPSTIPGQDKPAQPVQSKAAAEVGQFIPKVTLHDVTKLPSRGLAYPKESMIQYRPFAFGEVKMVSGANFNTKQSYEFILEGIETSFDKKKLTIPDLLYVGLLRKLSTMGTTECIAKYQCNKCGKPGRLIFKTDDLEFDELKIPALPIVADFSFGTFKFGPLNVEKYFMILDKGLENNEVALYAAQVEAPLEKFDMIYKAFYKAETDDAIILTEVDKHLYHSLMPVKKKCKNQMNKPKDGGQPKLCGNAIDIELDGGQALIMPFRKREESIGNRIRFGVEG